MACIRIIQTDKPLEDRAVVALRERLRAGGLIAAGQGAADVQAVVREIIDDVRGRGDQAVIELTARIEKVSLTRETLRVSAGRIRAAHAEAEPGFLSLVRRVADNIRAYQQSIRIEAPPPLERGGRRLAVRYTPVDRVGIYVPGGGKTGAALVSSMLMTVVPAQVAAVPQIALVSPPTSGGDVSARILAVAGELGLTEVYRVSGTAGLAALAIGTESIRPVDMIVGPGSAFIAEAKRQLFGIVGIDSIAGPSEVLIVADETARAEWVAADMLAQAEHDPGSAVLVTPSGELARAASAEIDRQLPALKRGDAIRKALKEYSAIIVVPDIDAACATADSFAAEHLQIITADDEAAMAKISHAGAIFLGAYSPVPLGDYCAGPSHVLPTGGTARFFSALSCNDFLKASSVVRYDAASVAEDAADVAEFAALEGLTAHAEAVRKRLGT
ncbi:MAG TPA: histidinol dehydrogenase [Phycisphaerae bacterium]|nr:histidinol dehydrogenase [Phycisphaerae bacterium]HUT60639.1 histidinol dehydrogenase [Phycisphaerae bacterium]